MDFFDTKQGKRLVKILLRTKNKRIEKKTLKELYGNLLVE